MGSPWKATKIPACCGVFLTASQRAEGGLRNDCLYKVGKTQGFFQEGGAGRVTGVEPTTPCPGRGEISFRGAASAAPTPQQRPLQAQPLTTAQVPSQGSPPPPRPVWHHLLPIHSDSHSWGMVSCQGHPLHRPCPQAGHPLAQLPWF